MDHSYYLRSATSRPLDASVQRRKEVASSPASSSFHGMITGPVMAHFRELEMRQFDSALYRETTQVFFSDIQFYSILGRGKYSTVYKVQLPSSGNLRTDNEEYYALKLLNPTRIQQQVSKGSTTTAKVLASAAEKMYREATILAAHHHPNIINLRGVAAEGLVGSFSSTDNQGYFLILELIQETLEQRIPKWQQYQKPRMWPSRRLSAKSSSSSTSSLLGDPDESRGDLPERNAVATAIASAVAYLHKHQIVVRDLCPESIGFNSRGMVKLFDLGLARSPQECLLDIQLDGNFRYMAPEIMICQSSGFPGDIYSFGVLLWELMTLQRPYDAYFTDEPGNDTPVFSQSKFTNQVILNKQWRPNCSTISDPETRRLIQECWCADPEARPNAEQVVWRLEQSITPGQRRRRSSYSQPRRRSSVLPNFSKGGTKSSPPRGRLSEMELAAAAVAADPSLFLDGYDDSDDGSQVEAIAEVSPADDGVFSFGDMIDSCLLEAPESKGKASIRDPSRSHSATDLRPRPAISKSKQPSSSISLNKIFEKKKEVEMGNGFSSIPGAFSSTYHSDQDFHEGMKLPAMTSRKEADTVVKESVEKTNGKKGFLFFSKKTTKKKIRG